MEAALQLMRHRGPDDDGVQRFGAGSGELVFGQTRLSIIDLSDGGHQPMSSHDQRFTLVFNGEIYNYRELRHELISLGSRFKTQSDTEVLLEAWRAWGRNCLPRLKGMFAFAVHDADKRTLTLARDAFGIKPLFYAAIAGSFTFASELRPVLECLPQRTTVNRQLAYEYLVWGKYGHGSETLFDNVRQLNPGGLLVLELDSENGPEESAWWQPDLMADSTMSFVEAAETVRSVFLENVRTHLRSDVPLGAALSGGLDSAAVVCAIRLLEPDMDIMTFTYAAAGTSVDERGWAHLVNEHVGAKSQMIEVTAEEFLDDLDDLIALQGEPFGSTSIYAQYRVMREARLSGVTVMLEGQGADELLGGYHGFPGPRLMSLLDQRRLGDLAKFLAAWRRWPGRSLTYAGQALALYAVSPEVTLRVVKRLNMASPPWLVPANLPSDRLEHYLGAASRSGSLRGRRLSAVSRRALTDHPLPSLLRHSDRNSMRWSVESRVPFLTTDFAELVLRLPEEYLVSAGGETKSVFRAAMRGIVPDAVLDRRDKIGFETPESTWLSEIGAELIGSWEGLQKFDFLSPQGCRGVLAQAVQPGAPIGSSAWRIFNFSRWARAMEPYLAG